jgi:protein disulfide-isomerase-like protein
LKSEPVPEKNDGPVRVLVGKLFKEEVLDTQKDVLILLHAPWCGHCQKMMPDFDKLGKAFAKNDNIVIAKMDATANDVESPAYKITGFPSLFFAKKGKGSEPMK